MDGCDAKNAVVFGASALRLTTIQLGGLVRIMGGTETTPSARSSYSTGIAAASRASLGMAWRKPRTAEARFVKSVCPCFQRHVESAYVIVGSFGAGVTSIGAAPRKRGVTYGMPCTVVPLRLMKMFNDT